MGHQKILVTGGAGFIGSHLVTALLNKGHDVVVLDDLSTGRPSNLPSSDRLRLIVGDVADPDAVRQALTGCDSFAHLAAIASVERSVREPLVTSRTNFQGSVVLFHEAAVQGVARGLYASSAAIYGDAGTVPISETTAPNPLTPYAADKLAGEHYLGYYHRAGKLNATAFRFFNVFGPRQDPSSPYSGVVSIFMDRAKQGKKVTVFGTGEQSRDFVYVSDVVTALIMALEQQARPTDMPIYNVARGESTTLLDLLDAIEALPQTGSDLVVEHARPREGDIRHSLADVTRISRDLGWSAQVPIAEGLALIASEDTY